MNRQKLDTMWAEMQLNNEARKLHGYKYVSICWFINESGEARVADVFESCDFDSVCNDFDRTVRAAKNMANTYKFESDTIYVASAFGVKRINHYCIIADKTYIVKYPKH